MADPVRAEDLLPDDATYAEVNGVTVRKGTIGAFLANVQTFQGLAPEDPQRPAVVAELRASIPLLRSLDLLDIFCFRSAELAALPDEEG